MKSLLSQARLDPPPGEPAPASRGSPAGSLAPAPASPRPVSDRGARPRPEALARPVARLLRRAERALRRRHLAAARRAAERALRMAPDHPEALHAAGRIALQGSDLARAAALSSRARELDPGSARFAYLVGLVAIARQRYGEAEVVLRSAFELAPDDRAIRFHLAETLRMEGDHGSAYEHLKALHWADPEDAAVRTALAKCLADLPGTGDSAGLERDLLHYLDLDGFAHDDLAPVIASLLARKWERAATGGAVGVGELAADPLLQRALRTVTLASPDLERRITAARRMLLIDCLRGGAVPASRFELCIGIALNSFNNEYLYGVEADEEAMVDGLLDLLGVALSQAGWVPAATLGAMAVAAMYVPLHEMPHAERMAGAPVEAWGPEVAPLVRRTLIGPRAEIDRAGGVGSISPVRDEVSRAVRAQYEANPYPRWLSRSRPERVSFREQLRHEVREIEPPPYVDDIPIRILVAGCGTGRQALDVADQITHGSVLAVDVSRRSLAYASGAAERDGIANVEFRHGDILELGGLGTRFHLIYCSGVLHHLEDPDAGLAILRRLLVPRGLIKLGLYSALARQPIAKARLVIERMGLAPTPRDIRRFRAAVRASAARPEFSGFESSPDFYSMSGCRDMLFHVQEGQFTVEGIAGLCRRHRLAFLGFSGLDAGTRARFRRLFPSDSRMATLPNWARFELEHPSTFARMYNFWCQAI